MRIIFDGEGTIIPVWQIHRVDPGYLYIIEDSGRYKIGKTRTENDRLRAAKTWLPDMKIISFKPFWAIHRHERLLHTALARNWYFGEWFKFDDDPEMEEYFLGEFDAFSNDNPDRNSIDFIYWFNGGMAEFPIEMKSQKLSLPGFRKLEPTVQKI